jgi:hypothetical protein
MTELDDCAILMDMCYGDYCMVDADMVIEDCVNACYSITSSDDEEDCWQQQQQQRRLPRRLMAPAPLREFPMLSQYASEAAPLYNVHPSIPEGRIKVSERDVEEHRGCHVAFKDVADRSWALRRSFAIIPTNGRVQDVRFEVLDRFDVDEVACLEILAVFSGPTKDPAMPEFAAFLVPVKLLENV